MQCLLCECEHCKQIERNYKILSCMYQKVLIPSAKNLLYNSEFYTTFVASNEDNQSNVRLDW